MVDQFSDSFIVYLGGFSHKERHADEDFNLIKSRVIDQQCERNVKPVTHLIF